MMESQRRFNSAFLSEKIEEGETLLRKPGLDKNLAADIESMLCNFYNYMKIDDGHFNPNRKKITLDEMYKGLTLKFDNDLFRLELDDWESMRNFCWRNEKPSLPPGNTHKLALNEETIVRNGLNFYKELDPELYYTANSIVTNPKGLINFSDDRTQYDHCFCCDYLNLPFVNVYKENDMSYVWFVHELSHGIDYLLYKNTPYLFSELSSILMETLYIDKMASQKTSNIDYNKFYSWRIHVNNDDMNMVFRYIEALYRFIESGCIINNETIPKILCCDNEQSIYNKYLFLMNTDFLERYQYILSFAQSLQLREYFYIDKKEALSLLKHILYKAPFDVNFDELSDSYSRYIHDVKKKIKKK